MSETTNLKLFKRDNPTTNTEKFDVEKSLNENWEKIDENAGSTNEKIKSLEETDSAIQADITAIKTDVDALKTDNENNKTDITKLKETTSKNAEEIEEIKQEQTTQNEKIEQNTSNIEQNANDIQQNKAETDEEIAKLKEENKLLKAQIPEGQASGNSIHIEDSSNMEFEWKINGGSRQKTTEGYNLLNVENDLNITNLEVNKVVEINLKANKTYTIKCDKIESDNTELKSCLFRFQYNSVDVTNPYARLPISTKTTTYTPPEDINSVRIYSGTSHNESATTNTTLKNLMIYEGTENKSYEPYTGGAPSPSPEYPSEVENVKNDVKMTVCNKNLIKADLKVQNKNGITAIQNEDGGIILNGIATSNVDIAITNGSWFDTSNIEKILKAGTYCIAFPKNNKVSFQVRGCKASTPKNVETLFNFNAQTVTFKEDVYITYAQILVEKGTELTDYEVKFQLEKGSQPTEYIPHEEQIITFPLSEGQKLYKDSYLASDGIHNKRKQIVLNGTENWNLNSSQQKENTLYFYEVQADMKVGSKLISNKFINRALWDKDVEGIQSVTDNNIRLRINSSRANTVEKLKQYLASNPVVVEYELSIEEIIQYTTEQQKVIDTVLHTYKNVTNISVDNELATLDITYKKDIETILNNKDKEYNERLSNIENLLSTTLTSALLLDNLENDLKEEV